MCAHLPFIALLMYMRARTHLNLPLHCIKIYYNLQSLSQPAC